MMFNSKEHNNVLRSLLETRTAQNRIPIWFMRQAGRYLPEYQEEMHDVTNFLQACYDIARVEKITLQPINRFDLDAAIIFSDIMTLPDAMGFKVDFPRGHAPKVSFQNRQKNNIERTIEILSPVLESIHRVRKKLAKNKELIGFIGAPWTLATYILGKEKNAKEIILQHRAGDRTLQNLIDELIEYSIMFLAKQAAAGADILQIFDSHAGDLPHDLFISFVLEPTHKIVKALKKTHPQTYIIGFPKGAGALYNLYAKASGVDATSIDYTVQPSWIRGNIAGIVQGNLDPAVVAHDADLAISQTKNILENLSSNPLIFNLGHGILPNTPPHHIELIVETVRNYSRR